MAGETSGAPHFWVNVNNSSPGAHHHHPCTKSPYASLGNGPLWLPTLCCF